MIPDTQLESYESLRQHLSHRHKSVVEAILENGNTLFELVEKMNLPVNYISGRLTELAKKGIICDSGDRKVNPNSGKKAIVWKIS